MVRFVRFIVRCVVFARFIGLIADSMSDLHGSFVRKASIDALNVRMMTFANGGVSLPTLTVQCSF